MWRKKHIVLCYGDTMEVTKTNPNSFPCYPGLPPPGLFYETKVCGPPESLPGDHKITTRQLRAGQF